MASYYHQTLSFSPLMSNNRLNNYNWLSRTVLEFSLFSTYAILLNLLENYVPHRAPRWKFPHLPKISWGIEWAWFQLWASIRPISFRFISGLFGSSKCKPKRHLVFEISVKSYTDYRLFFNHVFCVENRCLALRILNNIWLLAQIRVRLPDQFPAFLWRCEHLSDQYQCWRRWCYRHIRCCLCRFHWQHFHHSNYWCFFIRGPWAYAHCRHARYKWKSVEDTIETMLGNSKLRSSSCNSIRVHC